MFSSSPFFRTIILALTCFHLQVSPSSFVSGFEWELGTYEFTYDYEGWDEFAIAEDLDCTDMEVIEDSCSQEEDLKCPPYLNLAKQEPLENITECNGAKPEHENCLEDKDCPEGSFCCISLCEGISRCFNPKCKLFVPENNKNPKTPEELGNLCRCGNTVVPLITTPMRSTLLALFTTTPRTTTTTTTPTTTTTTTTTPKPTTTTTTTTTTTPKTTTTTTTPTTTTKPTEEETVECTSPTTPVAPADELTESEESTVDPTPPDEMDSDESTPDETVECTSPETPAFAAPRSMLATLARKM